MDFLKNTYLFRLFRHDKLLFAVISLYMLGILYYALRQREEFPFLLYGMYSLKEKPQDAYIAYSIKVDDTEIKYSKLRDSQRELITSTLENAESLIAKGKLNATDENKFKAWLMNYCLDMRMPNDSKMDVFKLSCNYDSAGQIKVLKRELVYSYVTK
jgi:hypothetical protein